MYKEESGYHRIQENSFISFIPQFNSLLSSKITERCNRKGVKQN